MKTFISIVDKFNFGLKVLLGVFITIAFIVMSWQIASRYIFNAPLAWSDELVRYLLVWITFIGAGLAIRYSKLIKLEFLFNLIKFPKKIETLLRSLATLLTITFCVIILIYSFEIIQTVHGQRSSSMKIPMSIPYASIPIGSFIMIVNTIVVWLEGEKTSSGEDVV